MISSRQVQQLLGCGLCNSRPCALSISEKNNTGPKHDTGGIGNQISQATMMGPADALRYFHDYPQFLS
jgi:hypothetical protein